MPRIAQASAGDSCYHIPNRGKGRSEVFHDASDYAAYLNLIAVVIAWLPMRELGQRMETRPFFVLGGRP
jgi:hypothetical protein